MRILAYVPLPLLARARAAVGSAHDIRLASDWAEVLRAVDRAAAEAVLIDPGLASTLDTRDLAHAIARRPGVPVVMYTTVSGRSMRGVATLAAAGVRHLLLCGYDDRPETIRRMVDQLPSAAASSAFLRRFDGALETLPGNVAAGIRRLFHAPGRMRNVGDLAAACGVSPRMLYRHLTRARLTSPHLLIATARVLRAAHHVYSGTAVGRAAETVGYQSTRLLRTHFAVTTGLKPRDVRHAPSLADSIDRLARLVAHRRRAG